MILRAKSSIWLSLGCSLLSPAPLRAAEPVANALVREIGEGQGPVKGPVWAVVRSEGGQLVVGSNELGVFDGARWQRVDVPGTYAFRALAEGGSSSGRDRVWVGAINAIGYVERGDGGQWCYVSLVERLKDTGLESPGDVWSAYAVGEGAVWITSDRVLRWKPGAAGAGEGSGKFEAWPLPASPHLAAFSDEDGVWIFQGGVGLLRIGQAGPPRLVVAANDLPGKAVTWLVRMPGTKTILVGIDDGAFRWTQGGAFERLEGLSEALQGSVPGSAAAVDGNRLVVGSLKGGVVLATAEGEVIERIAANNGLPDNVVHALWAGEGQVWAGLDKGLVRIEGLGETAFFDRGSGLGTGTPLKVFDLSGRAFVLTTSAFLRVEGLDSLQDLRLRPILDSQPALSDAAGVGGSLWVGGFGGVWHGDLKGGLDHIYHVSSDVFRVQAVAQVPQGVLIAENYILKILEESPNGWIARDVAVAVDDTPVSLVQMAAGLKDPKSDVWISTMLHGIYRFSWVEEANRPLLRLRAHYEPGSGFPRGITRPALVPLGPKLYVFSEQGILELADDGLAFVPASEAAGFLGIAGTQAKGGSAYWLVQSKSLAESGICAVLRVRLGTEGNLLTEAVEVPGLDSLGSATAIGETKEPSGPVLWVGGGRGLVRVDEKAVVPASPLPPPSIKRVEVSDKSGMRATGGGGAAFGPEARRLEFLYPSSAAVSGQAVFYQTKLAGVDSDWAAPATEAERSFGGLAPGKYLFSVRIMDRFGRAGPSASSGIVLIAPWYRRGPAWAAYALLVGLGATALVRGRVQHLRRQNEKLNQLVAERTKELELSNTAKSEFLENISHELRNPLNGLVGMMARIKDDELAPGQQEVMKTLKACAGQMTRAFEDVLGFSKIEYGYVRVEKKPFRLRGALEEIVGLHAAAAEQKGSSLEVVWPEDFQDGFIGDRSKVKTVIGNFVGNALKYAPGKPVKIEVAVQAAESDRTTGFQGSMVHLILEVIDRGPGIPLEEQELIFRKFVRGSDAKRRQVAGTGLGLATCRVMAKLMNGSVGLESVPGEGANFYLKLFIERSESPPKLAGPKPRDQNLASGSPAGHPVLIVEDEAYNQSVLEGIALDLGLRPEVVGDAEQAFERVRTRRYEVVFLDWELPGAKGGDVAQFIRGLPEGETPVILATTAHDSDEMRDRCRAAGMDGFLLKPYDADRVRRMIAQVEARRNGDLSREEDGELGDDLGSGDGGLNLNAFRHYARAHKKEPAEAALLFRRTIDSEMSALRETVSRDDAPAMALGAHRLRSLSGLIDAKDLAQAALHLEIAARSGTKEERSARWEMLQGACSTLKAMIS